MHMNFKSVGANLYRKSLVKQTNVLHVSKEKDIFKRSYFLGSVLWFASTAFIYFKKLLIMIR